MTLITRLSATFTDATLPVLRKDPILPNSSLTGAGDRILYDFKSVGTWPSQAATINIGDPVANLADTSVVDSVASAITASYNSATGAVTTSNGDLDNTGLALESAYDDIFADTTHDFLFIAWIKPNNAPFRKQIQKGDGDGNSTEKTIDIWTYNGTPRIQLAGSNNTFATGDSFFFENRTNQVTQIAAVLSKSTGSWIGYGYQDGVSAGATVALQAGSGASALFPLAGQTLEIINGPIYRVYVEDLTLSGRSHADVVAADWARGNGRFS